MIGQETSLHQWLSILSRLSWKTQNRKLSIILNEVCVRQGLSVYLILLQRTCHVLVAAGGIQDAL